MKTICDHNRLVARFGPLDIWVFLEEPGKCGSAERMRRSAPYLPVLQSSQFHGQTSINQDADSLGLAEVVGFSPTSQVLNHGRQVFRHRPAIMTEPVDAYQF